MPPSEHYVNSFIKMCCGPDLSQMLTCEMSRPHKFQHSVRYVGQIRINSGIHATLFLHFAWGQVNKSRHIWARYGPDFSAGIPSLVLRCLLGALFYSLYPQPVEADGHPFLRLVLLMFLPDKREFLLSTVTWCILRMGDWIKEKFQ